MAITDRSIFAVAMLITFMGLNMHGLGLPGSLTKSQPTEATATALNAFLQVPKKKLRFTTTGSELRK